MSTPRSAGLEAQATGMQNFNNILQRQTHRTHHNSAAAYNPTSTTTASWGPLGQEARCRIRRDNCQLLRSECRNPHQLSPVICGYAGKSARSCVSGNYPQSRVRNVVVTRKSCSLPAKLETVSCGKGMVVRRRLPRTW